MAAFKKLHALGPDIVAEVDKRLGKDGHTPSAVATWLQKDCQVLTELKHSSLKKNLERYRSGELHAKALKDVTDALAPKTAYELRQRLIAIDEMEEMARLQKGRVAKLLVKEAALPDGIVLKSASDELRLYKESLVELGRMQLETGVMRRAPKTINGTLTDPMTGEQKAFSWTEEYEELMGQISQLDAIQIPDAEVIPDKEPANG